MTSVTLEAIKACFMPIEFSKVKWHPSKLWKDKYFLLFLDGKMFFLQSRGRQ